MSRSGKTAKLAKRVTKSIRLTEEEAAALAQLVEGTAYAEAALLRQWVLAGMQQFRVAEAMRAYQDGQVDVQQAAARAQLPVEDVADCLITNGIAQVVQGALHAIVAPRLRRTPGVFSSS